MIHSSGRRWSALCLALVAFLLSGCMRIDTSVTIGDDSSIDVTSEYAVDKTKPLAGQGQPPTKDKICEPAASRLRLGGSKARPFEEGNWVGCRFSTRLTMEQLGNMIRREDRVYIVHLDASQFQAPEDLKEIDQFKLSVTFPGKVLSHNGSSTVSGRTVTWTNVSEVLSPSGVEARGEAGGLILLPWLVAGAGLLLGIGGYVLWSRRNDRAIAARAASSHFPSWGEPGNRGDTMNWPAAETTPEGTPTMNADATRSTMDSDATVIRHPR